jgi:hypothetical protein
MIGRVVLTKRFIWFVHHLVLFFYFLENMTHTAPPPPLDFSINAEQVEQITNEIINEELQVNDLVAALTPEEQTYENIVVRLTRIENELAGKKVLRGIMVLLLKQLYFRQGSIG